METEVVSFSFTWQALQLLGKSLYSNAWSAISELVANGFDAGATTVRVFLDVCEKSSSVVEIMDDGAGMNSDGIATYAKVGYDRRRDGLGSGPVRPEAIMGRKGIGKLAALYLTDNYCIQTTQSGITSTWQIDRGNSSPDDVPVLKKVDNAHCTPSIPDWSHAQKGTIIVMHNVDLKGLGGAAFDALSSRLANQFLISSMGEKKIELAIRSKKDEAIVFRPVEKSVAFRNMSFLASKFEDRASTPQDILDIMQFGNVVRMFLSPNKSPELVERNATIRSLEQLQDKNYPIDGYYRVDIDQIIDRDALTARPDARTSEGFVAIPYRLTGWLGLHATIAAQAARANDERFEKNQFYNPAQIRLYVRNKLASEELLNKLGITGAFANYIEGELSFDLLDDNLLPDIATSSRQGFDELDDRWILLKSILRPIVRQLINERQKIADDLKREASERQTSAKSEAFKTVRKELSAHTMLSDEDQRTIGSNIISQFQGSIDLEAKEDYRVFLSHRSADKLFTDFIYNFLIKRGARHDEFFYTSCEDPDKFDDIKPLADQIKRNIVSDNTLIAYFTSPHFLESQYCLFEGGAGWATRSVDEYLLMSTTYDGIPRYLTNDKQEMIAAPDETIQLDSRTYQIFRRFINQIINHINKGRSIKSEPRLTLLPDPQFPDKAELKKEGKIPQDYMDPMFLEYWDAYVVDSLNAYKIRPDIGEDPQ